ncbi:uncharacterized protein [Spinacia oleracea]|uniref:Transposase, Ptta/En/Spm, plant n=1 Tax=Spinacia oleracea TaxID=3562 RepID=A0ABM3QSF5_SPIOL|nr:uncharacterized protein LOC130461966 [Spinacia oleracea]
MIEDVMEDNFDQDGLTGRDGPDDAPLDEIEGALVNMDVDLDNPETVTKSKKSRGTFYCRKLTLLPPGKKINVEFDEDGNSIGPESSLFSFYLGQQVQNHSVCHVQVKLWEDFKLETLDHLWTCILEKCSFDDPEFRKENVMKHARRLFRDSRHKWKRKFFNDPTLKTKEERLKNKPPNMTKVDWKYLIELWSDSKFQEKSEKAKKSRSFQKMPHYNGTQSFARLKQDIMEQNDGKCTRLDVMVESRKRKSKSKKRVNVATLANNVHAVDELTKLKEQREQGIHKKTDEQIFQ